ncbi:MAG TPA: nickel pincer cofactor biosynthesis protein LarB [bacterium]|uniref:AIR carboxylase n=1 Tax=candidate division TA06 bacterium ADurb.Bin417 TaxID=1852828 RepID=A0A1V5MIV3_UNCT6|nr:MAG: AIR carboxylase [candidate division TA06 bacterium ADurb.Bin417]HNQ35416.1 nickel pincer cofactor biosynthesis protein LarB [bacterium]HNS48641.1 nickel pincer cofactor biosynthesis protein LarB [bacterium]
MNEKDLSELLRDYRSGRKSLQRTLDELKALPYRDLGFARLDTHRELRFGFPEVIYAPGKTDAQLAGIVKAIAAGRRPDRFLITRLAAERAPDLKLIHPALQYFPEARIATGPLPRPSGRGYVMVVSAGTADLPVAAEAELTARVLGSRVKRLHDVGVAGLHRLLDSVPLIQRATCLVVVAGMEGALPSVVGGLCGRPVIGVPTSVGYGASLSGLTPLFTMLNSCSPNVSVVNIDNGFGAGVLAHLISRR